MYYITEQQLKQILTAIKAMPVNVKDFDVADAWVGLYLTAQNIANQPVEQQKSELEEGSNESE